jgi:hypothetical protein
MTYLLVSRKFRAFLILSCTITLTSTTVLAQRAKRWVTINNPNYDNKRRVSFGMSLGLHSSSYKIRYSENFVSPGFDSLYSVDTGWSTGFSLGALINCKLGEFFDLRAVPKFSFYDHDVMYRFKGAGFTGEDVITESVMVELPVLLKYKSERRGNVRMYMIGGLKPGIEASGLRDLKKVATTLETKDWNLSADFGFGFDLYYPLFKFSPEITFSKGLVDILDNRTNKYGQPLDRLTTNTVNICFIFQ